VSVPVRSRLAPNILANLGGQLALLVLAVLAVKLVFSHLGPDALGMVLFVQTINVVLAGVLDLGVSSITIREVAAHADDDPGYVRDLLRTAATFYWSIFALAAVLMLVTAPWVAGHWVRLTTMDPGTAATVLRVLGVAALTVLPRALYISICRGLQRMVFNNAIEVGAGVLQQLGMVVILARGGSLLAVVIWMAATYAAAIVAYVVTVSRMLGAAAIVPGWSTRVIQRNARFSAHMMSISALGAIHTYVDKLVVSKLLPVASLGWYAFASSLVGRGALLTNAIADAAYPSLSDLVKRGQFAAMAAQYRRLQDVVCYLTVPLYAAVIYVSVPLFSVLFSSSVARALLLPVAILALGFYANGTLTIPYIYSLAMGKPEITSSLSLQALLLVVPITIASVALFGLTGAGLGFLSYHVFFYVAGVPRYCRECLRIAPSLWYAHAGKILALAAATYGLGFLAASQLGSGLPALAAAFVVASIGFAGVGFRTIDPDLRATLSRALRRPPGRWLSNAA
jgi:O-antigen/teichoic acid export membrane protein